MRQVVKASVWGLSSIDMIKKVTDIHTVVGGMSEDTPKMIGQGNMS